MRKTGTRKSKILKRRKKSSFRLKSLLKKTAIILVGVGVLAGGGRWLWTSGAVADAGFAAKTAFYGASSDLGFTIDNVYIEGRKFSDIQDIQKASGVMRGGSILAYDLKGAAERLSSLDWIKKATIRRDLPDTVYVALEEKRPLALLQREGKKLALIDTESQIITESPDERFSNLVIISGEGAAENFPDLLKLILAQPEIASKITIAKRVGDRRWNLYTANDARIQLPEDDVAYALARLDKYQKTDYVLDKPVKDIDLRYADRIVLQSIEDNTPRIIPADFNL